MQKLGVMIRGCASFLFICSVLAAMGLLFAVITEPFDFRMVIGGSVIGVMAHVSGSVALRGYAPKYLLFAHGPKQNT